MNMMRYEQLAHREYLKSATWKDIRTEVLKRDNGICQRCKMTGSDIHHKTYKNWGAEKLEELETLCRSCHDAHHKSNKAARKSKSIGTHALWRYLTSGQRSKLAAQLKIDLFTLERLIFNEANKEACKLGAKMLGFAYFYRQT